MALPPLVNYATVAEYRSHYERVYCRGNIQTFDGIRVFFRDNKFGHMFYESTARDGRKDFFRACVRSVLTGSNQHLSIRMLTCLQVGTRLRGGTTPLDAWLSSTRTSWSSWLWR